MDGTSSSCSEEEEETASQEIEPDPKGGQP
jgi:hypothetical protein